MSDISATYKFIVVGNSSVGKSCLILRFDENRFQPIHDVTVGVTFSIKIVKIEDKNIKVQIWDTAGQEVFRSITRSYYRDSVCAIIVYDITDNSSFEKVEDWIKDVCILAPEDCIIALFGNKTDIEAQRTVPTSQGQELADRHGIMFFETSALNGDNVENAFNECIHAVYTKKKNREQSQISQLDLNKNANETMCC
ncbi:Ras-related protein Rab-2A [Histomonas meleagridis]|uniref:Ras-related protein Rab-2A n=1 Tax=Histomonas meleagridis TaxID=135588 RepID=UPI003559633F|nr:Ras-related protein Rab-2A [Histomonas meleagridis]KAH0806049.1 Ras-related protein Rab-2A [Histomonas meleagridis]